MWVEEVEDVTHAVKLRSGIGIKVDLDVKPDPELEKGRTVLDRIKNRVERIDRPLIP